jgi:hypothetical protein
MDRIGIDSEKYTKRSGGPQDAIVIFFLFLFFLLLLFWDISSSVGNKRTKTR